MCVSTAPVADPGRKFQFFPGIKWSDALHTLGIGRGGVWSTLTKYEVHTSLPNDLTVSKTSKYLDFRFIGWVEIWLRSWKFHVFRTRNVRKSRRLVL